MSERAWRFYIDDMIDFGEHVLAYSQGLDQDGLVADRLHYDATIRNPDAVMDRSDFERAEEERAFMRAVVEGLADLEEGREVSLAEARARVSR
jgi:predicted transcriptional regulator